MLKGIEDIEGLTEDQITAINERAAGIQSKNDELLGKLSKSKEGLGQSESEVEALRMFKTNAEIQTAEDSKNWEETKRLMEEKHQSAIDKLSEQAQNSGQLVEKLLIVEGLNKALDSVRVNPALKSGAEAILRTQVVITDGKAMVGEKSLSEYVEEWSQTDSGKAFCLATSNSGGGAGGGSSEGSSSTSNLEGADKVRAGLKERLAQHGAG
jgi:hypothetical protein